jgi:hypothetical protein
MTDVAQGRGVMKSHPILVGLSVLSLAICVVGARGIWEQLHTFYPTPQTESGFLKNYTPKSVIERFQANDVGLGSSYSQHSGAGAGRNFVTHTAGFDWHFAMRSEKWMPLMNAFRDDVSAQLVHNGAEILSQSGDARDGFHFEYKLGNSIGTLTISPLSIDSHVWRATPLRQGLVDVRARIEQTETWFPKAPGTIAVRVDDHPR